MSYYSIKRNQAQYLEHLEKQNKAKRQRELSQNQNREQLVKKEQGFHLLTSGANEIRIREHRQREEKERSKSPVMRKRWGQNNTVNRSKWPKLDTPNGIIENPQEKTYDSLNPTAFSSLDFQSPNKSSSGPFKLAADLQLNSPRDFCDVNSLAERIDKLTTEKRHKFLEILEELEKN